MVSGGFYIYPSETWYTPWDVLMRDANGALTSRDIGAFRANYYCLNPDADEPVWVTKPHPVYITAPVLEETGNVSDQDAAAIQGFFANWTPAITNKHIGEVLIKNGRTYPGHRERRLQLINDILPNSHEFVEYNFGRH